MRQKPIISYFLNGFFLTNKSLEIFLISISLSLFNLLTNYTQNSFLGNILHFLDFILVFINIGFLLSLPVFLIQKQQSKALNYKQVVRVTLKNTKRLVIPGILLFILSAIFLVFLFVLFAILLHPSKEQVTIFFESIGKGWLPILLIPIVLISFLEFTAFFFSLEQNSLLSSLKKSIIVAFNNLHYIGIIIFINIISYTLNSFIPIETIWEQLLRIVLGGYIGLVLTASSLFYYQAVIKK